jgi:hypothetical protein
MWIYIWLVDSNPLKNISQMDLLLPIYGKITHVPNHQPEYQWPMFKTIQWPGILLRGPCAGREPWWESPAYQVIGSFYWEHIWKDGTWWFNQQEWWSDGIYIYTIYIYIMQYIYIMKYIYILIYMYILSIYIYCIIYMYIYILYNIYIYIVHIYIYIVHIYCML